MQNSSVQRNERVQSRCRVLMSETLEPRRLFSIANMPFSQVAPGFSAGRMLADRSRDLVYLLDQTNNRVLAVDTDLGRTTVSAPVDGQPTGLALSTDDNQLFVSSSAGNVIDVLRHS